ncbi:MAG: hypothetical protein ACO3QC_08075 [Phycisphaerales bacterium]
MNGSSLLTGLIGGLGCLLILGYSAANLVAAYSLLVGGWEWPWWLAVPVVMVVTRVFPPIISVAAFFGAYLEWGWPWYGALTFAAPFLVLGVLVLVGGGVAAAVSAVRSRLSARH